VFEQRLDIMGGTQAGSNEVLEATAAQSGSPMPVHARTAALGLHLLVDGLVNNWQLDPTDFHLEAVGRTTLHNHLRQSALSVV
jgi:TetR/AcrR family acrAB operon transcriptional repressor